VWEDRYEWVSLLGDPHKVETYKEGKNRFINLDSEVQGNMYSQVEECHETHFAVNLRSRTTLFYWRMVFLSKSSFYNNIY